MLASAVLQKDKKLSMDVSNKVILEDIDVAICATCGSQYDSAPQLCPTCADERQWVPDGGSTFTNLKELTESGRTIAFVPDVSDENIIWMQTTPPLAIGQCPQLVKTPSGYLIIESGPFITEEAVETILGYCRKDKLPFLGIAISHPHFYGSSSTWAKALDTKVYAHSNDRKYWTRASTRESLVHWWDGKTQKLGDQATMVLCGGHFDGSCVTHIDRSSYGKGGFVSSADTFMVGLGNEFRPQVSFLYSFPNNIPLLPKFIVGIWEAVKPFDFSDAYSAWPNRRLVGNARKVVHDSAVRGIRNMGYDPMSYNLVL